MKKFIALIFVLAMSSSVFAADVGKLKINISSPVKNNKYFLCLYSIGCLSIHAGNHGKTFPVAPSTDIGNIRKIVVADVSNMRMHTQASSQSCNVKIEKGQQLIISGQLSVKNNVPYISNLHCSKLA